MNLNLLFLIQNTSLSIFLKFKRSLRGQGNSISKNKNYRIQIIFYASFFKSSKAEYSWLQFIYIFEQQWAKLAYLQETFYKHLICILQCILLISLQKQFRKYNPYKMDNIDKPSRNCCRICFQESTSEKDEFQNFIKPCKCSDHVHINCLVKWANSPVTRFREQYSKDNNLKCQVCRQPLNLNKIQKYTFKSSQQIKLSIKHMLWFFISGIVWMLTCIGGMAFVLYLQLSQLLTSKTKGFQIVYIAWIVLPTFFIFWTYLLSTRYLLIRASFYSHKKNHYNAKKNSQPEKQFSFFSQFELSKYLPALNINNFMSYKKQ